MPNHANSNVYELEEKVQDIGRSISENLGQLEKRIQSLVTSLRQILQETKHVFSDVREGLNLTDRVEHHPLSMFGLSIVAGLMVGEKYKSAPEREPFTPPGDDLY